MRWPLFLPLLIALLCGGARTAEVLPPAPRDHFNDYAGIIAPGKAQALNEELAQFERTTSNQILVAIFPRMQTDSSIEDYTVRLFQAWGAGQKDRKNGAVLFVFSQDRKIRIVTGYGLEGVLPDALCKQIIETELVRPHAHPVLAQQGGVNEGLAVIGRHEAEGPGRIEHRS